MSGFVHLHCHSTWSLLDGAIPAEALPHVAAALGYEAVALTDHDSLLGVVRFAKACRDAGVKPIYGAELTIEASTGGGSQEHMTVIARNATGYGNLCRLITASHLTNERGRPSVSPEAFAERAEGLFVLSGCRRGEVARLAAAGDLPRAVEAARRWRRLIGDGYRVEVFDQRGYGDRTLRNRLLGVASEAGIPPVATNDVHYAVPSAAGTHELLAALRRIVPLSASNALRPNSEYYLKDPESMRALFADAPEAADETLSIAEGCDFDLDLGTYHFPHVSLPAGETPTGRLARLCYEGARRRYGSVPRVVEDRLQHELDLIFRMGFAAYFMVVADIVAHTRRVLGVRCACRGSAAGSLVCYVLGISDVDPVRYDLLFERFMNERRSELPDIDVDVESHRREEVLQHILDTYGADQTAVCCMTDTFRARLAIREVGKALGLPAEEIDLVAKAFPRVRASDIPRALERLPELKDSNLSSAAIEQLFDLCFEIDGFPRHLALHPSGVILSSPDLADRVPMQESFGGFTMLQADKDDVTELGLVKLDVLGVRMLSAISHAVGEVQRGGEQLLPGAYPPEPPAVDAVRRDDEVTYRLIRTSRTLGCFQIESPGQRELIARLQPHRFEDLIVDISLFRPGPVRSDMVSPYLDRRHGFADVAYTHPSLRPILGETHGVVVWHEQVIRVIAAVTGCSLADADYVRRHLDSAADEVAVGGPPVSPATKGIEGWFRDAAERNGYSSEQTEAIWREVSSFAAFGFCKSHAAAFALPTYLSAWLKAHYPAEFFAGLLTHDPGMYPLRLIVADARRFGVPILPLDVNCSDGVYRTEDLGTKKGVRMALSAVRDISEAEIASISSARPYTSLEDLLRRADVSRPVLCNLVSVGALDSISGGRSRRELLWRVGGLGGVGGHGSAKSRRGAASGPHDSLGRPGSGPHQLSFDLDEAVTCELPELPGLTPLEETESELAISGIDARRHLMELYEPMLAELGCTPADRLAAERTNSEVWVGGVKVSTQTPAIRSGQRIIFLTLDDLSGPVDVTVFERAQPRCAHTVFHSWLLVVKGVVRKRGGASLRYETDSHNVGLTVVADEVFDLAEIATHRREGLAVEESLERQRSRSTGSIAAPTPKPTVKLWHASGGSAGR